MVMIDEEARAAFRTAMLENKKACGFFLVQGRRIAEPEDIKDACYAVYKARVPFSRGQKSAFADKNRTIELNYQDAVDFLSKKIYNYFNNDAPNTPNTEGNFDKFHEELCNGFRSSANADRRRNGVPDLTYGNAQKLVNMTFKYLTTFEDYPAFSDLFAHCHMPIDRFVLYYFDRHGIAHGEDVKIDKNWKPVADYHGIPWTSLRQGEYKALLEEYRCALRSAYPGFTMLHLEYYIWRSVGAFCLHCKEECRVVGECERIVLPTPGIALPGTKTSFYSK